MIKREKRMTKQKKKERKKMIEYLSIKEGSNKLKKREEEEEIIK